MSLDDIIQQSEDWLCPTCGSKSSKKYLSIICRRSSDYIERYCPNCCDWYHYCDIKGKMIKHDDCKPRNGIFTELDSADYPINYGENWLCPECSSNPIPNKYWIEYMRLRRDLVWRYCSNSDCNSLFHYCESKYKMRDKGKCYCVSDEAYKKYI